MGVFNYEIIIILCLMSRKLELEESVKSRAESDNYEVQYA